MKLNSKSLLLQNKKKSKFNNNNIESNFDTYKIQITFQCLNFEFEKHSKTMCI